MQSIANRINIILLDVATIRGVECPKGTKTEVSRGAAQLLIREGKARRIQVAETTEAPSGEPQEEPEPAAQATIKTVDTEEESATRAAQPTRRHKQR